MLTDLCLLIIKGQRFLAPLVFGLYFKPMSHDNHQALTYSDDAGWCV